MKKFLNALFLTLLAHLVHVVMYRLLMIYWEKVMFRG